MSMRVVAKLPQPPSMQDSTWVNSYGKTILFTPGALPEGSGIIWLWILCCGRIKREFSVCPSRNGRGCRAGPGAAGTSLCKRNRAGGGIKDSSLQKPVPNGELEELFLICALPNKHLSMAAWAGPAPAMSLMYPAAALPRQTGCCWAGELLKSSLPAAGGKGSSLRAES